VEEIQKGSRDKDPKRKKVEGVEIGVPSLDERLEGVEINKRPR